MTQISQNRPPKSADDDVRRSLDEKSADFPPGRSPRMTEQKPVRLPDTASVETVLAGLEPHLADVELSAALNKAFPGFVFTVATIDDPYWCNPHDVVAADGTRLGDHRAWVEHELAEVGGDLNAFWNRHRQSGEKFAEWRGTTTFVFAPTGPGVADFVQVSLGREIEFLTGPVIEPDCRPRNVDDLFEPTWVLRGSAVETQQLAGPVYRLRGRSGGGIANPDWFDFVPRESRFFVASGRSSAAADRIFAHRHPRPRGSRACVTALELQ
ncbi:hypothetical protein [Mesorhizobium neociceri]|uniref:Uncharacterized protein n=1 Tax=Mesorhizobium neociceri TaxID=1307853 RepID=A0A838B8E3_9HYPH|nr:hypothetical protein [Mesorhizobium neociceri]MBA1142412.1 hypothetical protein [Mesorhizobium neociceri]